MISIKDNMSKKEMFVITDRAQGGTLSKDGQIDIMVKQSLMIISKKYTQYNKYIYLKDSQKTPF